MPCVCMSNHLVVWSVFTVHVILINLLFKGNPQSSTPQFTGVAGVQVITNIKVLYCMIKTQSAGSS